MSDNYALPPKIPLNNQGAELDRPGIYFVLLKEGVSLGSLLPGEERLIYIGKSESTLEARNHAEYRVSSSSTLRRSLGAILRKNHFPDKSVFPRESKKGLSGKALDRAIRNFRFSAQSEAVLSAWMQENLEYRYEIITAGIKEIRHREQQYIKHWNPVLNLKNCLHPRRDELAELRRQCREEAKRGHGHE